MRARLDARYADEYGRLSARARALLDRGRPAADDGRLLRDSDGAG